MAKILEVVATAVVFGLFNRIGSWFQIADGVSIFYPASAVDVVACMHFGWRGALGVFIGCLFTPWQDAEPLRMTAISGLLNVATGMIPWAVFRLRRDLFRDLHDFRSLVTFLLFGCVINSAVSSLIGNWLLIPGPLSETNLFMWFVSDFAACLLLAMPILAFAGGPLERVTGHGWQRPERTLVNAVEITAAIILLGWLATSLLQTMLIDAVDRQFEQEAVVGASSPSSDGAVRAKAWQDFRAQRLRIRRATVMMNVILLLILALASFNLIRRIARPLRQMHRQVAQLRTGHVFDASAIDTSFVEIRTLATTFEETSRNLKQHEEDLREQTSRAIEASKTKSEFLAKMSHELRTPLNSIIGFSEILLERIGSIEKERQESFIQNVLRSARHLLRLINDLLDMAKVESGKLEFLYEVVDLRAVVSTSIDSTRSLFLPKRQILELRMPETPLPVRVDALRVQQVMLNLLSNANKFGAEGSRVEVTIAIDGEQSRIDVRDEGMGIRPEDQEFIFEDFAQLQEGSRAGGTGLGLGLARRFVEAQGGSLTVTSALGQGSTFTVRLPVFRAESAPVSA